MKYDILREMWWNSSSIQSFQIEKVSLLDKKKNEKKFGIIIDKLSKYMESMPKKKEELERWSEEGEIILRKYMKNDSVFKLNFMDKHIREGMIESTKKFISEAKKFDKDMPLEDVGQAMRNVWIVNILQAIFYNEVKFSNAIFGYSMLYPYTDNYLDDINVSMKDKIEFNDKLLGRLKGNMRILFETEYEKKIDRLVENIEKVFLRDKHIKVYDSLLTIQEGQIRSLMQQENRTIPYENDILGISIEKGSSSVLVDGYLINGDLTQEQENFCLGYGFLLQIGDDLQDVRKDLENNHMTIMSQLAGRYDLDQLANKLLNFTIEFIEKHIILKNKENLKILVRNNCVMLILFSIVLSKKFFSKEYIDEIEGYLPFSIDYIEELKGKLEEKFKEKQKELSI
ncbi:hypothetical protein NNC19_11365 [Clostridium sp. SHJSY1]|uniref:hypothetical protein n=1 Tax=Clostridium sp. SHJSY1 TaxID=2942483 RepID=UPI0028742125|nr:hypothetical protein [Clostridium sp. SHJSY1]MDS0526280.1 hypothetical protein [Clostridium sp. SHJSY1]